MKSQAPVVGTEDWTDFWVLRLAANLLGYASVIVPGYLLIVFARRRGFLDSFEHGNWLARFIVRFVRGAEPDAESTMHQAKTERQKEHRTSAQTTGILMFCFFGLQISYLTWGYLQEMIMTQTYVNGVHTGKFKDSQFLVFVNRILAFVLSGLYLLNTRQPKHTAPIFKYSYCSLSNILSSWCQYEALKFVSFPVQVLAKASKVIPVMLMGKLVSRKSYENYEYLTAGMICVGMTVFLMNTEDENKGSSVTTISGYIILVGYMAFDSFTSNWQGELFKTYGMSSVQMMCGVNFVSCILTSVSLLQQGGFLTSVAFMLDFPHFAFHCIVLSICSATGQLFIFYTISQFGPVVFVIIMTVRQALAIIISSVAYDHELGFMGVVGVIVVFIAIGLRIYCSHRLKVIRRRQQEAKNLPL